MADDVTLDDAVAPEPTPAETLGNRYAAVRRVLKAGAPLSTTEYLLGQLIFVTMDVHAEIAGLRDEIAELNATNLELIVHRTTRK